MKIWLAAAVVGSAMLLHFPPERYGFYPRCPFFEAFGLLCPGCGATRAAAALLHGQVAEAMRWNALFVAVTAAVVLYAPVRLSLGKQAQPPPQVLACLLAAAVVFGVVRNVR